MGKNNSDFRHHGTVCVLQCTAGFRLNNRIFVKNRDQFEIAFEGLINSCGLPKGSEVDANPDIPCPGGEAPISGKWGGGCRGRSPGSTYDDCRTARLASHLTFARVGRPSHWESRYALTMWDQKKGD